MTVVFDNLQTIKKCLLRVEDIAIETRLEFLSEFCDELISAMHSLCHNTEHFYRNRKREVFARFMIGLENITEFWFDRIDVDEAVFRKHDYSQLKACVDIKKER